MIGQKGVKKIRSLTMNLGKRIVWAHVSPNQPPKGVLREWQLVAASAKSMLGRQAGGEPACLPQTPKANLT